MVAGYACGLDFSPEMSYLCRSLKQTSSEQMMRCGNYCVLLKFQFSLQWRWWRQGVHLGLEDHKVVVEVEGAWRCLHSGNLLFRSVLTLNYKTLLFTCSPHFTNIQTDPHLQVLWHPHEASKVATAGWDGVVKFWDWDFPNLFNGKSLCY